ncbi:DapE downstream ORF 2 [Nautilia profundicola AmH]|uniref:DapE downstream ORF 2 n=1 Tax=Nautilia profundicola (strain ATCC BAA-1463 / DSM 18972 / AmH) TaxID=598659 RepID=B9L9L9_NAUPA|nr:LOG family protein [Nautilia profundicola]ACM92114.1 DapE downstream ORF 2 [Nautilia profundicola AmH]
MKIVTTFGASRVDDAELYDEGVELGRFLAENGFTVKCGGYGGLMEAVSKGVKEGGGEVIGITLEYFDEIRPKNPYLTKRIPTKDLFERLKKLIEDSGMFIAQTGSIGTLNEIFMVWALKYGLGLDFRICLIGKIYEEFNNCTFIPKERLKDIEIYENLEVFKKNF